MPALLTKRQLTDDLRALGVSQGDTLLVHSAMKPLGGQPEGGCLGVIEALMDALGPSGTLLIPALSYATVTRESPFFSVSVTPSCVGRLSEAFRTMSGVVRSVHPTHSICAYGRLAAALTGEHMQDTTPVGPHSPFRLMMQEQGKILMLGCGLRPNTFMHGVEEAVGTPYVLSPSTVDYTCELADGSRILCSHTPHNFEGVTQRYDRVGLLLEQPALRRGMIAAADSFLIDARTLWDKAGQTIREQPFYFVDRQL